MDLKSAAAQAEQILEQVAKVEPTIATVASMFGGPAIAAGVTVAQPEILFQIPVLENALKQVAAGNNSSLFDAALVVAKQLTSGLPNSPILSSPAA
jgi:hypothetical protein